MAALDHLLAAALGSQNDGEEGLAQTVAGERLRLAVQYIEAHLHSPALSPAAVARHLCISLRQLHRVFDVSGNTVAAHIKRLRLKRARHWIESRPDVAVLAIAIGCGFESPATFYRSFKAEFGVTASELR